MTDLPHSGLADPVGVAVAQFAPTADSAANLAEIDALTRTAAARGAAVVVFPEYASAFLDPFDERLVEIAQPLDGPFVTGIRHLAAELGVTIVTGVTEAADGRVRNAVVAVDAGGIRATYRKLHLYDAFGQRESEWVEPGEIAAPETFEVGGLRFALMTCYDLRFPEVARIDADACADVIVVPAEWVRGPLKEHAWTTLLAARAIENTVYVVAADHPAPLGVGLSRIVDPLGVTIMGAASGTEVAVGFLDRDVIDRVRRVNPALGLRRFRVVPRD